MKVLLIEDDNKKAADISGFLESEGVSKSDVLRAKNMSEFAAALSQDIGLFIIDIKIPSVDGSASAENGLAILAAIVEAGKDDALLVAISSYPQDFPGIRDKFEARGCILCDYGKPEKWRSTLRHTLIQIKNNIRFDFLIFCALQIERDPFVSFPGGSRVNRGLVNCYDIKVGDLVGSVILLPKMGLVNAAAISSVCIDRYRPSVVAMSGICGGFSGHAKLGQLIVSSMAYEYQSGKWSEDGFLHEPYQVGVGHTLLTRLEAILESPDLLADIERDFRGQRPAEMHRPKLGIFTSGSAVIADEKFMNQVKETHRKVDAVDMEVFSLHRSAELSPHSPVCICAKTVVDMANGDKNDDLHAYGAHVSSRFILRAIADCLGD